MTSYRQSMGDTLELMNLMREASLLERDLTPDEEKRREEIAKKLPDDDFKKRYGDKWMAVKMATATKMMKKEEFDLDEAKFSAKEIKMAIGIASDKRYKGGNMTGAANAIDKIKPGLSDHPQVRAVLRRQNEETELDEDGHTDVSSAVRKCMTITEDAQDINSKLRTMSPEDSLPSWWTNKLAVASNDMNKMRDYIVNPVQEEVDLDEKMSSSDQDRLDDLLMAYRWGKSSYPYDEDAPDPDDVVKLIRKQFGNKIADQLVKSDDKIKVGYGPSDRKTPTRITKTGKANKADLNALKTRLKKKRDWDKIAPKGKLPEEVELEEGKMGDKWQKGAKSVKSGPFELMRGKSGVHAIMQNGKKLGDFSYDDDADNFVANMKGMKGQWTGNDIDSLFTHLQKVHKEEVELDEKVDKEKLKGAPPQSVLWGIKDGQFGGRLKYAYPTLQKMHDKELPKHAFNNFSKFGGDRTAYIKDLIARGVDKPLSKAAQKEIDKIIKDVTTKPKKEEVEIEEASAAADARRAMRRDPEMKQRAFSKDDSATDDDKKAASKNIMVQMRKAQSLNGKFDVEFQDGKKVKIPAKMAIAVQQKYNSMRKPADKEKFQAKIGKSYRDMLNALKEAVSPAQQAAIAISKKERGEKPKKESILDRIDRKIKENKNG